ncbi:conjugal transfer protein TraB [Streptomyces radicis]|uniref:Conjugal transfer protein TraB n=1 Tax=Streptomyces radicis TaxID=1750517 RepID=A0A3A9WHV7_9ACTN|nr:conjugal transfer protein TraB [Streptomyces radicis]RKN07286.1 conjugal transfer protein TraB [Streptomyces radicis]RKN26698.1 conjugal transfer protein TraB [Streptomyces radicis]
MTDTPKIAKLFLTPHTRPWAALAAEVPASVATHIVWGDSPAAAAAMTLAAGGLTVATWVASKGTAAVRRALATLSTGAGTGYLLVATVTDPFDPALISTLGIGGAALAGTWNVVTALKVRDAASGGPSETGVLVKSIGQARAKLRKKPEVEPNKVTAPLQLDGITPGELGNRIEAMAVELGISPTSIRILPDPERADRPELVIVPTDMLKESTPWPGPSNLGGSITDAIPIGPYEDGQIAELWLPADPATGRNATHFGVFGMNGSGKSAGWSVVVTEVLTRRDVIVWGADPSKGQQTFGPFMPYMDWCETTMAGAEAMAAALPQVITARADLMGRHGFKNWTPEVYEKLGMPYMVAWFEESAKLFRAGDVEMEGIVQEARSAGITVELSQQRPSSTSMPTDVREQLGGILCFGVKGSTTADMALPEDVRDAGARPEAWENRRPGYAYLVAPGVPEERYVMPLRTYNITDEQIAGTLAIAPRPVADQVTARAAGEAYANRPRHTADTTTIRQEGHTVRTRDDEEEEREAALDRHVERTIMEAAGITHDGTPDPDVDPDKEIPAVPTDRVWSLGQPPTGRTPQRRLTPGEAEAELLAILEEFREENRELIGPRDFSPFWGKDGRLNRSRAWLSEQLGELADAGLHLAETGDEGTYRLLHPEPANA